MVSDPTRYPEWSPECHRVEWVDDTHFVGHNRRRRGRWKTTATVVANEPDREFRFVVEMMGKDFTGWAYLVEPHAEGALLTEEFVMRVDLPLVARLFEVLALGVRDRRTDLRGQPRPLRPALFAALSSVRSANAPGGRPVSPGRPGRTDSVRRRSRVGICCSRPDQSNQRKRCTQSVVKRLGSRTVSLRSVFRCH